MNKNSGNRPMNTFQQGRKRIQDLKSPAAPAPALAGVKKPVTRPMPKRMY